MSRPKLGRPDGVCVDGGPGGVLGVGTTGRAGREVSSAATDTAAVVGADSEADTEPAREEAAAFTLEATLVVPKSPLAGTLLDTGAVSPDAFAVRLARAGVSPERVVVRATRAAFRAGAGRAIGISRQTARRRGIFHEMLRA